MEGIDFIKEYRAHPDRYLPMIDHQLKIFDKRSKHGEFNVGWNSGLLEPDRPYFLEYWALDGMSMLTIFLSDLGIETLSYEEIDRRLQAAGLYKRLPGTPCPKAHPHTDRSGNTFYSVNILIAAEDEMYVAQAARVYRFSVLNTLNQAQDGTENAGHA